MTMRERYQRPAGTRLKQLLDRLYRETGAGSRGASSFAAVCDMISIPRDLRAGLRDQLLRDCYITGQGDRVRLTEAGKQAALAPLPPPARAIPTPSPADRESRVRTPRSSAHPDA